MKNLVLLLLLFYTTAHAQNTYRISYIQEKSFADESQKRGFHNVKFKGRLIFNDSISFYYMIPNGSKKDKMEKLPVIGDKLIHHGLIYNSANKEVLHEVAWPEGKYFVIVDSPRRYSWTFSDNKKTILEHKCKLAYSVNQTNDTTMVWYSEEIKNAYGPAVFFGVPGLVLEVFDQSYASHFTAEKIELTSLTLMLPQNVERITVDKYKQQKSATLNE